MFRRLFTRKTAAVTPGYEPVESQLPAVDLIDIHCHCLPGIDDGPATMADSLRLCRALADEGVKTVFATPHQLGMYESRNSAPVIRQKALELSGCLRENNIELTVLPGADVRVDERLIELLETDQVMTLADAGRYLLLELPHEAFFDLSFMIKKLAAKGITAIITHPERHYHIINNPELVKPWLNAGAILQLTAGSLTGNFGKGPFDLAWYYLQTGLAGVVASDAHNIGTRRPLFAQAFGLIASKYGQERAIRLCYDKPLEIMNSY